MRLCPSPVLQINMLAQNVLWADVLADILSRGLVFFTNAFVTVPGVKVGTLTLTLEAKQAGRDLQVRVAGEKAF